MRKQFLGLVFNLFLFLGALCTSNSFANIQEIEGLVAKNQLALAMTAINKGLQSNPKDLEHLALKTRVESLMGDAESDEDAKVKLYEKAQETANKLIEAHPKSAKGYNRRAVSKGKLILFKGILESRSLVLELREDAKKVLEMSELDSYDEALANYLLGRAHLKLASKPRALRMPLGLAWASNKKGGEFLEKAVKLSPTTISFNLSYAEYLISQDNKSEAKKLLEKIATLEVFDPADPGHKETAKNILKDL